MYSNSLSFLVGSAQEKFANDIKKIEKNSKKLNDKGYKYNENSKSLKSIEKLDETLNHRLVKWSIRISLFLIFGTLFSFSIYKVVSYQKSCCNGTNFSKSRYYHRYPWLSQNTPIIYEIEPVTFYDSDNDGIGDLNGITLKLDYIQKSLLINCILIKNIQNAFSFKFYDLQITKFDGVDEKIGTIEDLKYLVTEARKRSIKVLLELQIASTSIEHKWFTDYELNLNYVTRNTIPENVDEIKQQWSFSPKSNLYYYSNGIENVAYLNYDDSQVQTNVIESISYWFDHKLTDGIYIKDLNQIICETKTSFNNFYNQLRKLSSNTQIRLVTDYTRGSSHNETNDTFDLYRVNLDTTKVLTQLISNINPLEEYLTANKSKNNYIWSFKSFDMPPYQYEQRRYMMIALYALIYSLPGSIIIRQGDELEYTNHPKVPQTFRWNDLITHSGFSSTTQLNLWWFPLRVNQIPVIEDGFDLALLNANKNSVINFIRLMNQNVKYKLISEKFNFNVTNSLFKMQRNTVNNRKSFLFLLNFSRNELQLSNYIQQQNDNKSNSSNSKAIKINTIFDSTYVSSFFHEITNSSYYFIKSNHHLILELETLDAI